jgi:sortase A
VKASALIIASFLMGALALALATSGQSVGARTGSDAAVAVVGAAIVEPPRTAQRFASPEHRDPVKNQPARIVIPRLHLKAPIGTNLDSGPIWWPVTGRPGGGDTIAVAGHRTTHTHPFLDLDQLVPGDVIYVRWQGTSYRYLMSGRRILSSKNEHIADARGYEVLLLTACTPKGSARQRIVIYARPDHVDRVSVSQRNAK